MFLAIRDKQICQFKEEIENRKKILCMKRKNLEKNVNENKFLNMILEDYKKYNRKMLNEKIKKMEFLEKINKYIEELKGDLKTTQKMMELSNYEQKEIVKEIKSLKNEIEDLNLNL